MRLKTLIYLSHGPRLCLRSPQSCNFNLWNEFERAQWKREKYMGLPHHSGDCSADHWGLMVFNAGGQQLSQVAKEES